MKNKRIILLGLTGALLASCSGGGTTDNKIRLTLWEDINNHAMLRTLLDQYIANYKETYPSAPELEITLYEEKESKAVSDLSLQGPSGQGPDVFAFVHDTLASAVTNDLIAKNIYANDTVINHSSDSVAAFSYEGEVYGYPITAESLTLMYDKSKLDESDVTSMENFKASGKKMVLDMANTDSSAYYSFSFSPDANLFGANGTDKNSLNLATPKAVTNLTDITKNYRDTIINQTPDSALSIIATGEADAVVSSPYLWALFKEQLGNNAAIAPLPTLNGDNQRPFSGYKGYGVSRYSKAPHLAHDLAKYLTDEFAQRYRFRQLGILPTFQSETIESEVEADDASRVFQASLDQSIVMPNIIAMGSFWAPMNDAATEIWNLGSGATEAQVESILVETTNSIKSSI
mgnify:CR=1 FL=1